MRLFQPLICALAALTFPTACGGPGDVAEAAYKAQAEGDHARAAELFGVALESGDASGAEYVELVVGRSQELAYVDAKVAVRLFLGAVKETEITLHEYSMVLSSLVSAGKFSEAVDILAAAASHYPDDPRVHELTRRIIGACSAAGDEAGLARFRGLGYCLWSQPFLS